MKRRDLLVLASSAVAGSMFAKAQAQPCPPPTLGIDSDVATSACVSGGTSAIAQQAATMASGSWAQVTPTPSGLSAFTGQSGASGLAIAYVDKMARDPTNKRLYFIGSDHNAPDIFVVYNESTNAWTQAASSVPWGYPGGTTSHGYDHSVYDTVHNKLWHRPFGKRTLRRWDAGTSWASANYTTLSYDSATAGVAWFPEMGANGRIVVYQVESGSNGGLISIDPVTLAETNHVSGSSSVLAGTGDPHCFMVYSPLKQLVVFGGGNGSRKVWRMNSAGTIVALDNIPAQITQTVGPASPCAIPFYNPSTGNVVVANSASVWYELNPTGTSGSQWAAKPGVANILSSNTNDGSGYGVASAPIPEYGVVAFVKNYSVSSPAQMWLWKP